MEKLKLYKVTNASADKQITVEDLVWLSDNGDLNSVTDSGWLTEEEWDQAGTNDFAVEEEFQGIRL